MGHIFTDSRQFQNTARRFAKFPRTRAAPPLVVIVVEKEYCMQILATVNRCIYGSHPKYILAQWQFYIQRRDHGAGLEDKVLPLFCCHLS